MNTNWNNKHGWPIAYCFNPWTLTRALLTIYVSSTKASLKLYISISINISSNALHTQLISTHTILTHKMPRSQKKQITKDFFKWFVCEHRIIVEQAWSAWSQDSGTPIIYLLYTNHGMQPWRCYLLAIIFYNNSTDTAGTAKLAALYLLANTDVPLITSPRQVDPWRGSRPTPPTRDGRLSWLSHPRRRSTPLGDIVSRTSALVVNLIGNLQIICMDSGDYVFRQLSNNLANFNRWKNKIQSAWCRI